ncbi:hypothetical protein MAPG_04713 [Magnaporthiopsis poae ATCC 64411]|uniref:PPPDE domain-containing protein n=1 Tax=Magnaporthiopsis poae (strain ATCC 64411 / 73-15) TaxID=644358 RepID=A0A0C4DXG0_MAGP6|nr:hypothetical protein MAPG_04713 [Magnaporthiopsis poae ATCC 64411]
MGLDSFHKKFTKATKAYITKKWEEVKHRAAELDPEAAAAAEAERALARERNEFLAPIAARLEQSRSPDAASADPGAGVSEMEQPLVYTRGTAQRAVLLVTTPIEFGPVELTKQSYRLLARHVGMSLSSVCHWALCVIDRGTGKSYSYDLMSDRLELNMIGKNIFRVNEVTPEFVQTWSNAYYVGETTKSHEEIQVLGERHMTLNPKYSLRESNCQHLAETLVRELCNGGRLISQHKLDEELKLISPKMAMDVIMAKLQNKLEDPGQGEESHSVKRDVDILGTLWARVKKHS